MILCEKLIPRVTAGGLHIPETAEDTSISKVYRMRVIAHGPGIAHAPGSPPVRLEIAFSDASGRHGVPVGEIQRLTCQEIVGQDFSIGDIIVCSRYNYNCDLEEAGRRRELRMVRAEDVLAVERQ